MAKSNPYRRLPEYRTFTGRYHNVSLDIIPQGSPTKRGRSFGPPAYSTELAFLRVYLDGSDATEQLASGYMLDLLAGLLAAVPVLQSSGEAEAYWWDAPYHLVMNGDRERNRVLLTLVVPGRAPAIQDADVPLHRFVSEVVRAGHEWLAYLRQHYRKEVTDFSVGKGYRQVEQLLRDAEAVAQDLDSDARQ